MQGVDKSRVVEANQHGVWIRVRPWPGLYQEDRSAPQRQVVAKRPHLEAVVVPADAADGREVAPDLLAPVLDFESLHHVVQRQLSDEYYHHTVIKTTFATFIKYAVIAAKIRDCVEVVSKRT